MLEDQSGPVRKIGLKLKFKVFIMFMHLCKDEIVNTVNNNLTNNGRKFYCLKENFPKKFYRNSIWYYLKI